MKKTKVISHKNIPTKLPLNSTAIVFLLLHTSNAPQWLWGALIAVWLIIWVVCITSIMTEEGVEIDVNKSKKP